MVTSNFFVREIQLNTAAETSTSYALSFCFQKSIVACNPLLYETLGAQPVSRLSFLLSLFSRYISPCRLGLVSQFMVPLHFKSLSIF
jgi:hypothetical protein